MPHVHVIHSDDPSGAIKQLKAVVPELSSRFRFTWAKAERGWSGVWAARKQLAAERPDVWHTIGPGAFRIARWLKFSDVNKRFPNWVASGVAGCGTGSQIVRYLVPLVDAVITHSAGEFGRVQERIRVGCLHRIRPTVVLGEPALAHELQLPKRFLLAAGGFDAVANLKSAIWAFDVLKYMEPGLHLVLLGDGPQLRDVRRFAHSLAFDDDRVHFLGWQPDVTPFVERATAVWTTHTGGGNQFALEAMALGKPVVAMRSCDTEFLIRDGVNGVLVPHDDPVGMAAATRGLLADLERMERIGRAAKEAVPDYPLAEMVIAYAAVYDNLIGSAVGNRSSLPCSVTC